MMIIIDKMLNNDVRHQKMYSILFHLNEGQKQVILIFIDRSQNGNNLWQYIQSKKEASKILLMFHT